MPNPLFDALFAPHLNSPRVFLIHPDGSETTYGAFLEEAAQIAHALGGLGVSAGDRVVVQIEKSQQALALYAACVMTGAVFLPLNTGYTAAELGYFVENAEAKLFVFDSAKSEGLIPVADAAAATPVTLNADGTGSLMEAAARHPNHFVPVDRAPDDLAALLYTSGTTGRSKGAMLSQDNLLSNARTLSELWRFTADDKLIHALPIFHTHGLFVASNIALLTGASMLFLPKFDLDQVLAAMPSMTAMMGVPTLYTRLLSSDRFTAEVAGNMRLFVSGSAPLLAETHVQFEARTGHRILERYGMTETNMNTSNPYDGERRAGTVGFPLPDVELNVTDPDTGASLPQGEIGMIEVRGPNVFQGYWRMPEKTAEELRPDGFFITGDLGKLDADGYVHIVGRGKDLIISGGYNIYPKELELLIDDQPGVLESAVIGVPHPDFGETPVAIIVPKGDGPDLSLIETALAENLARFKRPSKLILVDALPRNTMGKVQKAELRKTFGPE